MSKYSEFLLEGKFAGTQVSTRRNNVDKSLLLSDMIRTVHDVKLTLSEKYLSTSSGVANDFACLTHLGSCCDSRYTLPRVVLDVSYSMMITTGNLSTAHKVTGS